MDGYYSIEELKNIGFAKVGEDVLISKKASLYGVSAMSIGNHVRIDDFALLVGNIEIHDYVHIAAFSNLHASRDGHIIFEDYSGVSANVTIYASSDLYDGSAMTARPGLSEESVSTVCRTVVIGKYSQIGTGSTVL